MSAKINQTLIENRIFLIRGQKVMIDEDLSRLYCVSTKRLNEQVKRNIKRFPKDFMFRLNNKEKESLMLQMEPMSLRSQIATSKRGGRRFLPYAFNKKGERMN